MAQKGCVWRKGNSWFLRWRENGKLKNKHLAPHCDRYRTKSDLDDLAAEVMAHVKRAAKCPHSSDSFTEYVEDFYLPFVLRAKKPSTYAGYKTYFERYIKPRVGEYALRDFTVAIVAGLLKDIASAHDVNRDTVTKVRSILSGIFSFAMSEGHFPGKNAEENPASKARIPETAKEPGDPEAATRDEVKAILAALKAQASLNLPELPLARAAVALGAMCGMGPAELRGLYWSDWDRAKQQIHIQRNYWHTFEGTTKTKQRVRFVSVTAELREILLALWNEQGSPIDGYILAAPEEKSKPVILDNLANRTIRPRLDAVREATEEDKKAALTWRSWYALRRFHGTAVRAESNLETTSRALGNSKAVADRHYVKPAEVLPDVRKAVKNAVSGLTDVQPMFNGPVN
jgi:integrase